MDEPILKSWIMSFLPAIAGQIDKLPEIDFLEHAHI